jgi:8-oxo-dGTP pyrophosphatase MutT (NUDIX family)
MPDKPVREKVVCYIVRDGRLLVFRHVDHPWEEVGIQVPAGSIKPGETPEQAALREAAEETGLTTLKLLGKLGETTYDITPYRHELHHRHVFHLTVTEDTPERWLSSEDDHGDTPIRFECLWIPLAHGHVLQAGQGALLWRLPADVI